MREYRDLDWHWPSPAYVEVAATYEGPLLAALARFEAQYGEIVTEYFETLLRLANVPPWWILYGPVLPPTIGLLRPQATLQSTGSQAISSTTCGDSPSKQVGNCPKSTVLCLGHGEASAIGRGSGRVVTI